MNTNLSERISYIVKNSKLNQTEFANRISISQQYLSQICNAKKIPSDRTIVDICREFGCDEVWLRTGEGEPFRQQSKEEQIMRFAVQTVKGSDEFRKSFVSMLAQLDQEDWKHLSEIYQKLQDKHKKD